MQSLFTYVCLLLNDITYLTSQLTIPIRKYQFSSPPKINNAVDVLTYNINSISWQMSTNTERILSALISSNADIICLQETNASWEKKLSSETKLWKQYPHRFFHHPQPFQRSTSGLAILSRYPLSNTQIIDFSNEIGPESVFPALVTTLPQTPLGNIHLACIHLRPPLLLNGQATLSTYRVTSPIRQREMKSLLNQHPSLDIITGDFNEQDKGHALCMASNMRNALTDHVPSYKETHRWPFLKLLTLRKRLDHILYQKHRFKCMTCGVLSGYEEGASDHQPVLARFVLLDGG